MVIIGHGHGHDLEFCGHGFGLGLKPGHGLGLEIMVASTLLFRRQHVGTRLGQHLRAGRAVSGSEIAGRDVIAAERQLQRSAHVPPGRGVLRVARSRTDDVRLLEQVDDSSTT